MPFSKPIEAKQAASVPRQAKAELPCNGSAKDRSSELCAAWYSADAARAATVWTIANVVIAFFGFVGLGVTIWFTRKTFKATVTAERPHVRFYRTIKTKGKRGQIISVSGINFRNYGRTPALVKSLSLDYKLCLSPPLPSTAAIYRKWPDDSVMPQDEEWPRKHYIAPLDRTVKLGELLSKHDENGLRLFVFGELRYADAFGDIHVSCFCRVWDGQNFTYAENADDMRFNYSD